MAYTPHFALQKEWKHQIFNLSYSEGYNSPTAASSFITATNTTNDDLKPERAKCLISVYMAFTEYKAGLPYFCIQNRLFR